MAMLKRRGFMGGLSALLASPAASALDQAGVTISGSMSAGHAVGQPTEAVNLASAVSREFFGGARNWWTAEKLKTLAVQKMAPWLLEAKRIEDTKNVSTLDINIASLRSVSPAGKINMQRNLQYRRWLQDKMDFYNWRDLDEKWDNFT